MDQDGLSIALALASLAILLSGLWRGSFDIQFFHADRSRQPLIYWPCVVVLAIVFVESARRAVFIGCVEC
ncbi:MAG TPA: hypothetical protein VM422_13185 [Amaricoccus sp.]|nr:hypothetical protein [Amaricoccus sp.]